MNDGPSWFVIVLLTAGCVVVLTALGSVVYFVVRFVLGIFEAYREHREHPERVFHDPAFGPMSGRFGFWTGYVSLADDEIRFTLDGSELRPDQRELDRLREIIPRLRQLEQAAQEFLKADSCTQEQLSECRRNNPAVNPNAKFVLNALDLISSDGPDSLSLEFSHEWEEVGCFRVDFEKGQPVAAGWDD